MIVPDINLLLYAYNAHAPQYLHASEWWEEAMNGEELIGLPNEVCLGFVRIAANPRLGSAAVAPEQARMVVDGWLALPQVRILTPGPDHFSRVMDLTAQAMGSGTLISDATLAAYALEHRATLYSNDTDFARFAGLKWINPLAP